MKMMQHFACQYKENKNNIVMTLRVFLVDKTKIDSNNSLREKIYYSHKIGSKNCTIPSDEI